MIVPGVWTKAIGKLHRRLIGSYRRQYRPAGQPEESRSLDSRASTIADPACHAELQTQPGCLLKERIPPPVASKEQVLMAFCSTKVETHGDRKSAKMPR